MPLKTSYTFSATATETEASLGSGAQSSSLRHIFADTLNMATGTAANKSDVVYSISTTVATGVPDAYDLLGSLTSVLNGAAISFVEVTLIAIRNKSSSTGEIIVVGAGSNPIDTVFSAAGDSIDIGPGGLFVWSSPVDGAAPTAGTADIITLTTSATSISYDLLIVGRSA